MNYLRYLLIVFLSLSALNAKMFQSINSPENGMFVQSGNAKYYCQSCGMNLVKFYKTSHIHNNHQYCSLHCLYEATKGNPPKDVKVVDVTSLKFIDANNAYYVAGSDIKGTMTRNSKYAFKNLKDAEKFRKKNGGKNVNFSEAYAIAGEDFQKDLKMIQIKKEKKIYKVGEKLYKKKCPSIDVVKFNSIAELKFKAKEVCKVKKDKPLQAIAIYLWDIEKKGKKVQKNGSISVPKNAKCPVCGMFVYKYPKWAALIEEDGKKLYFDGVKDMFKYYISKKEKINIEDIYVTDYFSSKKIKAKYAYYVMGSNVYGPMGNELIPFRSELDANAFKKDHFGIKIFAFLQIVEDKDVMKDLEEL